MFKNFIFLTMLFTTLSCGEERKHVVSQSSENNKEQKDVSQILDQAQFEPCEKEFRLVPKSSLMMLKVGTVIQICLPHEAIRASVSFDKNLKFLKSPSSNEIRFVVLKESRLSIKISSEWEDHRKLIYSANYGTEPNETSL